MLEPSRATEGCSALTLLDPLNDSILRQGAVTVGVCLEAYSMFFVAFGSVEPAFLSCKTSRWTALHVPCSGHSVSFCASAPRGISPGSQAFVTPRLYVCRAVGVP
jgi:hypothetical protein